MGLKDKEEGNYPDLPKKPTRPLSDEEKKNIIKITQETDEAITAWGKALHDLMWANYNQPRMIFLHPDHYNALKDSLGEWIPDTAPTDTFKNVNRGEYRHTLKDAACQAEEPAVCECGVDKLGYGLHSDWCPKHE